MRRILFFLLCPTLAFSQTTWEKIDPIKFMETIRNFENSIGEHESYSFTTEYSIYKRYTDTIPIKLFYGKLTSKEGEEINMVQEGITMLQDKFLNITIDTIQKKIIVQSPDSSFNYRKSINDYTALTDIASQLYMKKDNETTKYLVEFNPRAPYQGIEYTFKNNVFISEVTIYSNNSYQADGETEQARDEKSKVCIRIREFQKGKNTDFSEFKKISEYIAMNKKTNSLKPVGKYVQYEIIDLRN